MVIYAKNFTLQIQITERREHIFIQAWTNMAMAERGQDNSRLMQAKKQEE